MCKNFEICVKHCRENFSNVQADYSEQSVQFMIGGENAIYLAQLKVDETILRVVFQSMIKIHKGARPDVAEFIARANFQMTIGRLELDFEKGLFLFHGSTSIQEELSEEIIKQLIVFSGTAIDALFPGVIEILYSASEPQEVFERIKLQLH